MKLQSMLLPTGEFVLVLSEAPEAYAAWAEGLKNRTGAAAMLVTTESVEVENALVDENATRRDPVEVDPSWLRVPDRPVVNGHGIQVFRGEDEILRLGAPTLTQQDLDITQNLMNGVEYSPAGLVKDGPKTTADLEPELIEAFKEKDPHSWDYRTPVDKEPVVEAEKLEKPSFEVGDRVVLTGKGFPMHADDPNLEGIVGTVTRTEVHSYPGAVMVGFQHPGEEYERTWYVLPEGLERLDHG